MYVVFSLIQVTHYIVLTRVIANSKLSMGPLENYIIVCYLVVVVITCFGCGNGCSCGDLVEPVMTWFWLQEVVVKVAGSFGGGCS